MPERKTRRRAEQDKRAGKSSSSQAGEFVREEMHHIREGKHGARRSTKQAIAIGLSKARRAGVDLKPPKPGKASETTRKKAEQDIKKGKQAKEGKTGAPRARSKSSTAALKRESRAAASKPALSRQARSAAGKRSAADRSAAARKAAATRKARQAGREARH